MSPRIVPWGTPQDKASQTHATTFGLHMQPGWCNHSLIYGQKQIKNNPIISRKQLEITHYLEKIEQIY